MSDAITGTVDFFSKVATIGAFGATIATFAILHKSTRKNEQYRIANEISKSFAEVEYKIIETPVEKEKELEAHFKQYLNVWEWFVLLVKNGQLKEKSIIEHFKPFLITHYERIFTAYPTLKEDKHEYEQFKILYQKWKSS
jgi:Domain of unknown function (DUF4760)